MGIRRGGPGKAESHHEKERTEHRHNEAEKEWPSRPAVTAYC